MMYAESISLLALFPAVVLSLSCEPKNGGNVCARFDLECETADEEKLRVVTAFHDFTPLPIVERMDKKPLWFYPSIKQFVRIEDPSNFEPGRGGIDTISPDGYATDACVKESTITWSASIPDDNIGGNYSSSYFVCDELDGVLINPAGCCQTFECDDVKTYVDFSTCQMVWTTKPENTTVVLEIVAKQSNTETCTSPAARNRAYSGRAVLRMVIAATVSVSSLFF